MKNEIPKTWTSISTEFFQPIGDMLPRFDSQTVTWSATVRFYVVEKRRLWRECLFRCMGRLHSDAVLVGCNSVEECIEKIATEPKPDAIFLCVGPGESTPDEIHSEIRHLVDAVDPIPVVVLSDSEDIAEMISAQDCGARGCVPANVALDVAFEAMKMAAAGGFVLTPDGLEELRAIVSKKNQSDEHIEDGLTTRQAAVAEALRQGKQNKIIAYELGMRENTVKVHVRNILKKLNATNRTEAAFKLNESHTAR